MSTFKLYYFEYKGRAELARLVLVAAEKDYEDIRISLDDWPNHKQKMPFGQMPLLEIDGKEKLCQSYAIARYLANEFGLAGKDKIQRAQADMYVGVVDDVYAPCVTIYFDEKDEIRKAELLKKFKDETAKNYLSKIDEILGKCPSGYLVGDSLTYADFALLVLQDFLEDMMKTDAAEVLSPYANLRAHRQKISSLPKIAAWLSKRPQSEF